MRPVLLSAALLLVACSDGVTAVPDPTTSSQEAASSGAGGDDAIAVGAGGSGGDGGASSSSAETVASSAAATSSASSSSTGSGGEAPTSGGGYEDGARLRAVTINGMDGSKQQVGWFDTEINEACAFRVAGDGQLRCLPPASTATYFIDAACTERVAIVGAGCAPLPYVSTPVGAAACYYGPYSLDPLTGVDLRTVGAEVEPVQLFQTSGANCVSLGAPSPTLAYFSVGDVVPSANFVAGTYDGN